MQPVGPDESMRPVATGVLIILVQHPSAYAYACFPQSCVFPHLDCFLTLLPLASVPYNPSTSNLHQPPVFCIDIQRYGVWDGKQVRVYQNRE
jgi:hypothetical protein